MSEAIVLYNKHEYNPLSDNFNAKEFTCGCAGLRCNFTLIHSMLVRPLQALRFRAERPLHITSGFRCQEHNEAEGGASNSYHVKGMAADFTCADLEDVFAMITSDDYLRKRFKGVGYYRMKNFIHVDVREAKEQIVWLA